MPFDLSPAGVMCTRTLGPVFPVCCLKLLFLPDFLLISLLGLCLPLPTPSWFLPSLPFFCPLLPWALSPTLSPPAFYTAAPLTSAGILPVMQSLCPDGQRDEFGFLQYANST